MTAVATPSRPRIVHRKSGAPRWAIVAVALATLGLAAPAAAQPARPIELRLATSAPQKSVWGMQLERTAAALAEESAGEVAAQVYFAGQLGSDVEVVQQVARGRIDLGATPLAFLASLAPELQVLTLQLYYRSAAEQDCVLDAMTGPVTERLARRGVQFVGWSESGSGSIAGKRPFESPADVAGLKAGAYGSRHQVLFWQALGANVAPISSPELVSAFQTGLIDAAITVPGFYVSAGVHKAAPVLTLGPFSYVPSVVFMNKAAFDRLAPRHQAAVLRSRGRTPISELRREVREFEARMVAAHQQAGGRVVTLNRAQLEAFRRAVEPAWPAMVASAGPDAPALLEQLEAARRGCEGRG